MKHFILMTIITLFIGCGSTPTAEVTDTPSVPKQTPISAENIFTIGDDQNVLEGSNVKITASILDDTKEFTKFTWTEDRKVISTDEEFIAESLSVGEHHISLEMVDQDGNIYEDTVVVVIKKETSNKPPVAKDLTFELKEDEQFMGSLGGSDEDGDALSYIFVSFPQHGRLSGSAANLRFTPDANYNGSDSFVYKTNDSTIDSEYATVSINIEAVNDAPVATAQTVTLAENSSKEITLTATDLEHDNLTFTVITPPENGVFDGTNYTPKPNYNGTDSFTFIANDSKLDSSPATIVLAITSVNNAPVGVADTNSTLEDTPIIIDVLANDSDVENEPLTIGAITQPDNGTVQIIDNTISYTPNQNFHGTDAFTYQPRDGLENGLAVMVTVTVTSVNDIPVLNEIPNFSITEDSLLNDTFTATDADSNDLLTFSTTDTLEGFSLEDNGSFSFNSSHIMYQSLNVGDDIIQSIPIVVTDGIESVTKNFVIQVTGQNDAPIAHYDYNQTDEDSNLTFNLLINDIDIDSNATLALVDINHTEGNFTFTADGNLTFSPNGDFDYLTENEEYNVTLTSLMQDEYNITSEANVTIVIYGINDAPMVSSIESITIDENVTIGTGQIVANDAENTPLTFESNSTLISIDNNGTYTFNTDNNYNDLAEGVTKEIPIMITISDGESNITQEIIVTIIGVNTSPSVEIGTDYNITQNESISFGITSSGDVDGNITQYSWRLDGTLESTTESFDYNFTQEGNYTISLTVTDDKNATAIDGLTVVVNPVANSEIIFVKQTILGGFSKLEGAYVADVNRDGFIDILTADSIGGLNGWFENDKNGSFDNTHNEIDSTSNGTESVYSIDLDRDGDMDILSGMDSKKEWRWYENDGSEVFSNTTSITTTYTGTNYIGATDLNKDGYVDVLVGSWSGSIYWYENNETQGFEAHEVISGRGKVNTVIPADFDNDGDIDFVAALYGDGNVTWYENNGTQSFTEHMIYGNTPKVYSVSVADIDQDGFMDIISGPDNSGKLYIFHNDQNRTFTSTSLTNMATDYGTSITGDLDNDGDIDILYAAYDNNEIGWYKNDGTGTFSSKIVIDNTTSNKPLDIYTADLDNDGDLDFALALDGEYAWYENKMFTGDEVLRLSQTGQIISYSDIFLDDGDYQKGIASNFSKNYLTDIVKDSSTGLMWQDNNDSLAKTLIWADAMTYCEDSILGGFHDWRLPEIQTLYYLAKKDSVSTLAQPPFENVAAAEYWSSDLNPDLSYATFVDFSNATEDAIYTKDVIVLGHLVSSAPKKNIRCVRGNREKFNLSRDETNAVVTDSRHKLIWDDSSESNSTTATWQDAIDYCENSGWRLPNIHELYSIVDPAKSDFAFESSFVYTSSEKFWSSTTDNESDPAVEKRYGIKFDYGHDFSESNSSKLYNVRCVKDLP